MATTEATVEVLTAEVRALMVGSRQVTLSVFRQLDWVDWDDILPMGRVNDYRENVTGQMVVGRHAKDGTLVRAWLHRVRDPRTWESSEGKTFRAEVEHDYRLVNPQPWYSGQDDFDAIHRAWREAMDEHVNGIMLGEVAKLVEAWNIYWKRHRAFDALPLIVLAGLK